MHPKAIEIPFVIRVAVTSVIFGWKGRIKSSMTSRAAAFRNVDNELFIRLLVAISSQFVLARNLNAALKTPATKRPGRPGRLPNVSIRK